jgi:hypothetical protein
MGLQRLSASGSSFSYNTCSKHATKSVKIRTSYSGQVIRVESRHDAAGGKTRLRDRHNAAWRSNVTVAFFRWIDVSPTDFILETEPRHEQATARRMLMPLQERQVLLLKSSGSMVFDLILDEWLQSSR